MRDRVPNLRVSDILDRRNEEAHLARGEFLQLHRFGCHHAQGVHIEGAAVRHDLGTVALAQTAINDACQDNHAAVSVKPRVKD